jgi:hypothetical protein
MEGSATFVYTELKQKPPEIRLLKVFPAAELNAGVECALGCVSLNNANYNALSYTWGDPKDLLPIHVNGHQFLVRRNLELALRHLRKTMNSQSGPMSSDKLKFIGEEPHGNLAAVPG